MRSLYRVGMITLVLGVAACSSDPSGRVYKQSLPELVYAAIDKMTLNGPLEISPIVPITVSSISESTRLDTTSTFGNIIADFARSRLAQNRMDVSEPRLRTAMKLKTDQGEIVLSRDAKSLVNPPLSAAVVTGTYGIGDESVYVSLKLIGSNNTKILAAADFVVRRQGDVDSLLIH